MATATERIAFLNKLIETAGFEKQALKTTDFNVETDYSNERDRNGGFKRVFNGYICRHSLKLEFDFDTKRLAQILSEISKSPAKPEISVRFTVKDPNAVSGKLLEAAAVNAREKALALCRAAGVEMGRLVSVRYDWDEISMLSRTQYNMDETSLIRCAGTREQPEFEPEDISAEDTAVFVWEII